MNSFFWKKKKFFKLPGTGIQTSAKTGEDFWSEDAPEIKKTESITNHDVKAVEYFIKNALDKCNAGHLQEWVHFGLTSQDINNTAIPLLWKNVELEYLPAVINLQHAIGKLAITWKDIPMLARTHGQPASPTRLRKRNDGVCGKTGKPDHQFSAYIPFTAKFGGATGNFNAHHVAFPKENWIKFANDFTEQTWITTPAIHHTDRTLR